jgi:hypothetical protein
MYKEVVWRKGEERCERTLIQTVQQAQAVQQVQQVQQTVQQVQPLRPSKREEANHKLSDRYLVGQANFNPFMPTNNYVNDLEVQMNFLTPQKNL